MADPTRGKGKRGGARVHYLWLPHRGMIYRKRYERWLKASKLVQAWEANRRPTGQHYCSLGWWSGTPRWFSRLDAREAWSRAGQEGPEKHGSGAQGSKESSLRLAQGVLARQNRAGRWREGRPNDEACRSASLDRSSLGLTPLAPPFVARHVRRTNVTLFLINAAGAALVVYVSTPVIEAFGRVEGEQGNQGIVLGMCALALALCGWNLVKLVRRVMRPDRHPIWRELARYGAPAVVASAIDHEVQAGVRLFRVKWTTLTPSWLLMGTRFGLKVLRLADVVWVYPRVTRHYQYSGFRGAPRAGESLYVGRTFGVIVQQREGRALEIPCRQRDLEPVVRSLVERTPWAIVGYDAQLDQQWQTDRTPIARMVDERRGESRP